MGWARTARYHILHLGRLPDTPARVSLGIACGVFVCFTPLYGVHFLLATILAFLLRANVAAALVSTFFGNPITFPFIAAASMFTGRWILGYNTDGQEQNIFAQFFVVGEDLWHNFLAIFTADSADWSAFPVFLKSIFLPYFVGGIWFGFVFAAGSYYLSLRFMRFRQRRKQRKNKEREET